MPTAKPLFLASALFLALAGGAWADSPVLQRVLPRGGQRGAEVEVTLGGARLKDAREIFFYKPGIEVLKLEASDESVKARLKIAEDAPLGEHPLRVRTATGITELRTFYVGRFPSTEEKEPNGDFAQPQKIDLNVTVSGSIPQEDVDHFLVELKKGQRITAEIEGIRLGTALFDPYVAILDMKRFELAASDDTVLALQDSVVSMIAPEDGTYVIQVRESSYGGSSDSWYRLHVGTFPRPLVAYPPGGRPGEKISLTFLGDVRGAFAQEITLPSTPGRHPVYGEQEGLAPPSPNFVRVTDCPSIMEAEPNNERAQATATDFPLPVALNGFIDAGGDEDWFRFSAKKGQSFDVRVYARALRSPLDATMTIHAKGSEGAPLLRNDDQGGPDPAGRFTAPADGEYEIRIRDHLRRGGKDCVYRVEFEPVRPGVYTHIPAYEREPRGQVRQTVTVPRGNRYATWIRVNRAEFKGDMKLEFVDLPAGVTALAETIPADIDRVPVVFEAAADAPVAGRLADVVARSTDPKQEISGGFRQDVNLVLGNPNNTVYYGTRVDRLAVAVGEEAPFKISVVEPKVPLVRGGTMNLKVRVERKADFKASLVLKMLWNPPGVAAQVEVKVPEGANEADYPINADGGAATREWKIAILGSAEGADGTVWVSTPPARITIDTPFVAMSIPMSSVEQGRATDVLCKLDVQKPFEGKAKVVLYGLPAQVTFEPAEREITKEDKEVVFKVSADPKAPAGQHKTLFCVVVVTRDGEPMFHNVGGGGILRIDLPPPSKKDAPLLKADPSAKKPAEEKRLSPLEKLRLEAAGEGNK